MSKPDKLSRRHFMVLSAMGIGGMYALSRCTSKNYIHHLFLTDAEGQLLDALVEQMVPTDDWPGGRDAGLTHFIDLQLVGPYSRYQEIYRGGLAAIQKTCIQQFKTTFETLGWDEQTLFLQRMELGKMQGEDWKNNLDRQFFRLLRDHSLQGYYGSPRHGGNKNYTSYKMLRLDYPVIIGQNRYKS